MRLSPALLCLTLAACYRYVPSAAVPSTGDEVRITLSTDAMQRLTPLLGPRTASLTGRILADGASGFDLAVDRTFKDDGAAVVWSGDHVTIPRNGIAQTERRVLDRQRTLLAAGGILVGAIVGAFVFSKFHSDAGGSDLGGMPPVTP